MPPKRNPTDINLDRMLIEQIRKRRDILLERSNNDIEIEQDNEIDIETETNPEMEIETDIEDDYIKKSTRSWRDPPKIVKKNRDGLVPSEVAVKKLYKKFKYDLERITKRGYPDFFIDRKYGVKGYIEVKVIDFTDAQTEVFPTINEQITIEIVGKFKGKYISIGYFRFDKSILHKV